MAWKLEREPAMTTRTHPRRSGRRSATETTDGRLDAEALRARLVAGRERILHRVGQVDGDLQSLHEHVRPSELEEGAQERHLAEILNHLGERDRRELAAIDAALARLAAGAYGICPTCEEPIPPARLAVLPTARTCVECAELEPRVPRYAPAEPLEIESSPE
jgi:RNA polymerase-binding transcription factor DksA